jgi:hypothetical protein
MDKQLAILTQVTATNVGREKVIRLVFKKNANFFAENSDHNIDPRHSPSHLGPIRRNSRCRFYLQITILAKCL